MKLETFICAVFYALIELAIIALGIASFWLKTPDNAMLALLGAVVTGVIFTKNIKQQIKENK